MESILLDVVERSTEHTDAPIEDPVEQLQPPNGRPYCRCSIESAGHAAVLSRLDLIDSGDDFFAACGLDAYDEVRQTVERLRDTHNPDLDVEMACKLLRATVQGLGSPCRPRTV